MFEHCMNRDGWKMHWHTNIWNFDVLHSITTLKGWKLAVKPSVTFLSLLIRDQADKHPRWLQSHLTCKWMPIVPSPTEDKSQMCVGFSGFFVQCERGIRQIPAGSCHWAKGATCSLPEIHVTSLKGHNAVKCWHCFHVGRHGSVETRVSHTG